ncbi:amidohydrolase family protein [Streptomyces sp. NPDC004134]|uniref:amidohydrolase family protein n=1 Tax=Streptomyces sp. NPDC004134 TaxID=3364691 RepID=UPI0036BACB82
MTADNGPAGPVNGPQAPDTWALTGVTALLGEELTPTREATIVITGGRITAAGPLHDPGPAVPRLHRPDLLVTPGFLNGHTHIGDAAFAEAGFRTEGVDLLYAPDGQRWQLMARASDEQLVTGMRQAMQTMIRCGVVAFEDFREQGRHGVDLLRQAARGLPIRALALGRHAGLPFTTAQLQANTGGLSEEARAEIRDILDVADGFSVVSPNQLTDTALAQTADLVRAAGKRLAAHVSERDADRQTSLARTGRSDITRAIEILHPDYLVHATAATPEELRAAARAGMAVVMCPRSHAGLGFGVPPYLGAVAAGVEVALGTDNVMTTTPSLHEEANFLVKAERWRTGTVRHPDPGRLLAAMTVTAAQVLGATDLGSLGVGKAATFVAFDTASPNLAAAAANDPAAALVNRATAGDIAAVVFDGRTAVGTLGHPVLPVTGSGPSPAQPYGPS